MAGEDGQEGLAVLVCNTGGWEDGLIWHYSLDGESGVGSDMGVSGGSRSN